MARGQESITRVDELSYPFPQWLSADDKCYYIYNYVSQADFETHPGTSQVINFKKKPSNCSEWELFYRRQTIALFAEILAKNLSERSVVIPVPPSALPNEAEYDSRFEDLGEALIRKACDIGKPGIRFDWPIIPIESRSSAHGSSTGPRSPEPLLATWKWRGFSARFLEGTDVAVIVDDVLTSGASFHAMKELIRDHYPRATVGGFFLAKTTWK